MPGRQGKNRFESDQVTLDQRQENSTGSRGWIGSPAGQEEFFEISSRRISIELPRQIGKEGRIDRGNRLGRNEMGVVFRHLETAIPLPGIAATRLTTITGNIAARLEGDGANTLTGSRQVEPESEGQCQKEACCQLSLHERNRNPTPSRLSMPSRFSPIQHWPTERG